VTGWFERLSLHRKLVAMALAVATIALVLAVTGLILAGVWRYRATVGEDTRVLARVIAENTAAAVLFDDVADADETLDSVSVRDSVVRACLYRATGELFARFERSTEAPCPPTTPAEFDRWNAVGIAAPIRRNDRTLGVVYVERALPELWTGTAVAVGVGLLMLLGAGLATIPIANRLQRRISEPIVQLAGAVRRLDPDRPGQTLPPIATDLTEIGELMRAFDDLLQRVRGAHDDLRRQESERTLLLDREREASRLKDEFLAAVSHELRTPLSTIVNWAQVLTARPPDPATLTRAVASIARSAHTQARVIEDLVDVSRIVAGKLNLRADTVDLRDVVDGASEIVRSAANQRQIGIRVEQPEAPCLVTGDRDRLQQVVGNLLSNAVKFSPSGSAVEVGLIGVDGGYEVRVKDHGIGIAPDFLPFVFDRFRQADGSMTREHGGLGLGLAIVKEITALHGGSVHVESEGRDRGAAFAVRLPARAAAGRTPEPDGATPVLDRALAGVRVLSVDDNADAVEVLRVALESVGAVVTAAPSGAAALALLPQAQADVLLLDLSMPDMDGYELLRRIRQSGDGLSAAPAIALSAHASEDHRRRSRAAGFHQHLAKPYTIAALVQAIVAALRPDAAAAPVRPGGDGSDTPSERAPRA
jgi:signal transduction histidine kinase/CheY-like chemotaxis protein